jgi:hypothetical protein
MDQVDACLGKIGQRRVKGVAKQRRKCPVPGVVITAQVLVDLIATLPRWAVSVPLIDTEAPCLKAEHLDGLQEGAVGVA